MKAFEFDLKMKDRTIKTFVYSETGLDIEERFPNMTVSNIKETDDPIKQRPNKKEEEYWIAKWSRTRKILWLDAMEDATRKWHR